MAQVRSKKATRVPKTRATGAASGASKPRSGPAPSGAGRRRWTMLFAEGNATMRDLLGGKGAGLAEMSRIGLPVPPGFTITTEACLEYYRRSRQLPAGLMDEVRQKMRLLEARTGKRFGDATKPLLVSVRSGAKFSMPGMIDRKSTRLNSSHITSSYAVFCLKKKTVFVGEAEPAAGRGVILGLAGFERAVFDLLQRAAELADQAFMQDVVAKDLRCAGAADQGIGQQVYRSGPGIAHCVAHREHVVFVDADRAGE